MKRAKYMLMTCRRLLGKTALLGSGSWWWWWRSIRKTRSSWRSLAKAFCFYFPDLSFQLPDEWGLLLDSLSFDNGVEILIFLASIVCFFPEEPNRCHKPTKHPSAWTALTRIHSPPHPHPQAQSHPLRWSIQTKWWIGSSGKDTWPRYNLVVTSLSHLPCRRLEWADLFFTPSNSNGTGLNRFLNRYVVTNRMDIRKFLVNLELTIVQSCSWSR